MLVDLDHPQSLTVIAVEDRFDAGGLSGPRVAVQKDVVGHAALYKSLRIGDQFLLLQLISDQVLKFHVAGRGDRDQKLLVLIAVVDPKRLVEAKFADPVGLIESGDDIVHLLLGAVVLIRLFLFEILFHRLDRRAQLLHFFADAAVEHSLRFSHCVIVLKNAEAVNSQSSLYFAKVIIEQLPEDPKIVEREGIDASLIGADFLGDQGERRLRCRDQIGQIIVPQIFVEPVFGGKVQQAVHLLINVLDHGLFVAVPLVEAAADLREIPHYAVLSYSSVNDQFGCKAVHDFLSFHTVARFFMP